MEPSRISTSIPRFARSGYGVDVHCHDVGLQDPSTVIKPASVSEQEDSCSNSNAKPTKPAANKPEGKQQQILKDDDDDGKLTQKTLSQSSISTSNPASSNTDDIMSLSDFSTQSAATAPVFMDTSIQQPKSYQDWIKQMQAKRHENTKNPISEQYSFEGLTKVFPEPMKILPEQSGIMDDSLPPAFPHCHLFADESVEQYALKQTTPCSRNILKAAQITDEQGMFLPCMVGALESQFLKMVASLGQCKRILDVGTFTGMSAIAFAESGSDVKVTTVEFDEKTANVAQSIFDTLDNDVRSRIEMKVGDARDFMKDMATNGEKFDLIFLDADKENYDTYYEICLGGADGNGDGTVDEGILANSGVILADNSACALLYDENDERRNALHRFNRCVAMDTRVEQVLLTVREGITMIRRKN